MAPLFKTVQGSRIDIADAMRRANDAEADTPDADEPDIRVIEVKANGSRLNDGQQLGGESHFGSVPDRYTNDNNPTWKVLHHTNGQTAPTSMSLRGMLRRSQISRDDLDGASYELWKYDNVDPDRAGPVSPPKTTDWSSGTNANQFELDANNVRIQSTRERWH